jgi:photosystem II stability/assembly factor-like uncharacterized protein
MTKYWQTGAGLLLGVVTFGAVIATPLARAPQAADPNVMVDPAILSSMQFRHLSVFSRGGRSTAVAGVPSNPTLFYLGTTGGGVWQTTNSGESWTNISDGFFEAGSIGAIDVSLSNPQVIYVGTGSACPRGNVSPGVGMYKSSDAGKTWKHIGLRSSGTIGRIVVHPTNPDLVYVAVLGNMFAPSKDRGVYRSKDGGTTWQQVHAISDRTGAVDLTMDPKNPDVLIAAMWTTERKPWTIESGSTEAGLFRTANGGDTWTKLGGGLPDTVMVGRIGVSISPADPRRVYAQIEAGNDLGGVYVSRDGGLTWTAGYKDRDLQQRAWYYTHIEADPVDVDTVYGLNVGAAKSTDGGKTFGNAGIQSHSDYHDMWINPTNNKIMIVGNDGGGTVSTGVAGPNGLWSGQENQPTSEIYRVTTDNRYPYWVYGAQQDNSTTAVPSQGNEATYSVGGGESGYIAVDPRDHGIVYAGNYGGAISRTNTRMGLSESVRVYADSQTGQRAADMKFRFQWNSPILISPHNPDVVYTTSQVVHRTTDGGMNWDVISRDLTRNDKRRQQYSGGEGVSRDNTGVEVYATIFAFEESLTTPGLIWTGSDDGLVHVSRDNGKTWTNVTPADWPEGTINTIDPSHHDPARAVVSMHRYRMGDFTPYLFETNDYGKTWKRIADGKNGIPNWHFTRTVREDPKRKGLLYAGTEFGLYVSFNSGVNWQRFQQNLPITPVSDIEIYRNDLIVATQGRGFWIMDNLAPVQSVAAGMQTAPAAVLFKPEDSYRAGGRLPTFQYWFRDKPTAPVDIVVTDAAGAQVYTTTAQPADRPAPAAAGAAPGGRGGRGGGGGGGGRGGRGGPGGGAAATAYQGMNAATWNPRGPSLFTVPPRVIMWGGGSGPGPGAKLKPGTYTVKVTSGSWSATHPFVLHPDPRLPRATPAQYDQQFKMTNDIGAITKRLYDELAKIRDAKAQLVKHREAAAGQQAPVAAAIKALEDKLVGVESVLTQIQGEGGQDSLNFPGRLDNQWVVLYQNAANAERWPVKGVIDRYNDLLPETNKLFADITAVLTKDVAAYNAVATKAGLAAVVIK